MASRNDHRWFAVQRIVLAGGNLKNTRDTDDSETHAAPMMICALVSANPKARIR
jgi:hypothetical protein